MGCGNTGEAPYRLRKSALQRDDAGTDRTALVGGFRRADSHDTKRGRSAHLRLARNAGIRLFYGLFEVLLHPENAVRRVPRLLHTAPEGHIDGHIALKERETRKPAR